MKQAVVTAFHNMAPGSYAEILQAAGDLGGIDCYGTHVLVGVYKRATRTASGLIVGEDAFDQRYQGCVGAVLKLGPQAFSDSDPKQVAYFGGKFPKPGDWVFHEVHRSALFSYKGAGAVRPKGRDKDGWDVRLVYSADIIGRVTDPNSLV